MFVLPLRRLCQGGHTLYWYTLYEEGAVSRSPRRAKVPPPSVLLWSSVAKPAMDPGESVRATAISSTRRPWSAERQAFQRPQETAEVPGDRGGR